jgi:ethanolamine utilization microcompartment shell protein EutS
MASPALQAKFKIGPQAAANVMGIRMLKPSEFRAILQGDTTSAAAAAAATSAPNK